MFHQLQNEFFINFIGKMFSYCKQTGLLNVMLHRKPYSTPINFIETVFVKKESTY